MTAQPFMDLESRRAAAMLAADVDVLDELMDEHCYYIHSSGTSDSKTAYLEALRSGHLQYKTIQALDQQVLLHEGCALVVFHFDAVATVAGHEKHIDTLCTAVWSRGDHPQLLAFQSTSLPG